MKEASVWTRQGLFILDLVFDISGHNPLKQV